MKRKVALGMLAQQRVLLQDSDESRELLNKSGFGKKLENGQIQLSLLEGLFLLEANKIDIKDGRKKLKSEDIIKHASKYSRHFWVRYSVFKDIRERGYICKTALKFGAEFRVYERGIKPGQDHAKWVLFPVHETDRLTWYEFAAKNRVAHSTKKKLVLGIVDDESDVTYYECKWLRP